MTYDSLLARARASVEAKTKRGVYTPELLASLDEPLDFRPDPAFAAGPAWPEAVRTAAVAVEPPARSTRPLAGPVITALKRAVERGLRWYLPPVAEQVSAHNRAVIDVLAEHNKQIVELRAEMEQLRRRLAVLEARPRRDPRCD
jgi:hypothetical protein